MVWSGAYGPPVRLLGLLITLAALLATADATPPVASAATYARIEGSGSTSAELLLQQWVADADSVGMKIDYSARGSSTGRSDFAHASTDFGISDIPYQGVDESGAPDTSGDRDFAYVPVTASGTAFSYHLTVGGRMIRNLRLSSATIAKIFTNRVTSWDDPAIARDNNGRRFPSLPVTPVVRSDGAGTTAQLTAWLDHEHPGLWRPYLGRAGWTSYYPRQAGTRMVGRAGSDAVMNLIRSGAGNGAIGYVEYTYPLMADFPAAQVLNSAGYYVGPTAGDAAVALTAATVSGDLVVDLDDVWTNPDPRAYPLSAYSYLLLPTGADDPRMTTGKRQALTDFLQYALCEGQSKAAPYGYAPLPSNLVQAGFDQVAKLHEADPAVELPELNAGSCGDPTADAPQPQACQARGAGPCGTAGPPTNRRRPSITGPVRVGTRAAADPGRWTGERGFRYQWLADGEPIAGARRPTYRIPVSLVGSRLRVRVTAMSAEFPPRTVSSAARRVRASG